MAIRRIIPAVLILALSVIAPPATAWVHGNFVAGKTILNVFDTISGTGSSFPFANFLLSGFGSCSSPSGFAYPGILDSNGFPSTASLTQPINCQVHLPASACVITSHCILDWKGTNGSVGNPGVFISGPTTIVSGGAFVSGATTFNTTTFGVNGSIEFYFNSPPSNPAFDFQGGAQYALTQMRLYRVSDQAAVNLNSNAFNPDILAAARALNPLAWRMMDAANTNTNLTTDISQENPLTALSFSSGGWVPSQWAGTASGTDTYTATLSGFTLTDGAEIQLQFTNANTVTTPTLNVGGLGAKTIVNTSAEALSVGSIPANGLATLKFDAILQEYIYKPGSNSTGYPTAIQVAFCDATNISCWVNIPPHATDAYAIAIATYVRDHLSVNLTAIYEYSNEVWNFANPQTHWAVQRGAALGFPSASFSTLQQASDFYALRDRQIMANIATVYGSLTNYRPALAFSAFVMTPSQVNSYRLLGLDLTLDTNGHYTTGPVGSGCGGAGTGLAVVVNFSASTVCTVASQGTPVSIAQAHNGVLSYATYDQGAILNDGNGYGGTYAAGDLSTCGVAGTNSGGLRCAADNFALGTPSAIAAAFAWLDNDIRAGTKNAVLGTQTLSSLNSVTYPAYATIATSYSLPIWGYEGHFQGVAPTTAQCTTIGISTTYGGAGGLVDLMLTGYKNSALFQQLEVDQATQMVAASPAGSRAATYTLTEGGGPWALYLTDLYSATWKSWNAVAQLNH